MYRGAQQLSELRYVCLEIPELMVLESTRGTEGRGFESFRPHFLCNGWSPIR